MNLKKITPFLVFFGIIEIVLILITLYYSLIENTGGMALAAYIAFIAAVIVLSIISIERWIVSSKLIKEKPLWIGEIIIILILIVYVSINGIHIG